MADGADTNIWQELLKTTAGKESPQLIPSDVIVLGDRKNGKTAILSKLKSRQAVPNSPEYILDYSYLNVINRFASDKEEVYSRMGVWSLDDETHADLLVEFTGSLIRTAYVITLDFAKPWLLLDSLNKWLQVFKATAEKKLAKLSPEEQAALKKKLSTQIQGYMDPSKKHESVAVDVGAEAPKEGAPVSGGPVEVVVDPSIPLHNFGVPLIVVGCKADYFNQIKSASGDRFEFVTQRLRKTLLDWGASIVYTSAVGEGTNVQIVEDLLYSRAFDFPLKHAPKVVGSPEDFAIFSPSGFDSIELIRAATTGKKSGWGDETPFSEVFEHDHKSTEKKEEVGVEALDDEDFFQSLASQLQSGKADPKPAPTKKKDNKGMKNFFKNLAASA